MSPAHRFQSVFRPGLFSGQVALVTGAGSGLGRCTAHELAALGARVALLGRKPEKLEKTRAEIAEAGGEARSYACDIREESQVAQTVSNILRELGRVDALVNNAGGQFSAPLEKISAKGWETVVRTNLTGGFLVARECYTQWMKGAGSGSIVNIIADMWLGMPGMGHSGAARAGMLSFTETAAYEWAHAGVRVNAVAPGWIASSGMDSYGEAMAAHIRGLKKHVPLRRMAEEAEVSAVIVFLLSPGAAFVTGITVQIDGGASLGQAAFPTQDHDRSQPFEGFHRAVKPKAG